MNRGTASTLESPGVLRLFAQALRLRRKLGRLAPGTLRARRGRAAFYRDAWIRAAGEIGAEVVSEGPDGLEIRLGEQRTRVRENHVPLDTADTRCLAGDKPLVYALLAEEGLPVPPHREFRLERLADAFSFLEGAGGDCVVKPARGTGAGEGITTGIRTRAQLVRAAVASAAFTPALLIERQVPGENYRLLYLDGVLIDAVARHAPMVTGDGSTSIRGLIRRTNAARLDRGWKEAQVLLSVDMDLLRTLEGQDLGLDTVLPPGRVARLKTVVNENAAMDNVRVGPLLCKPLVRAGAAAAAAVGSRLAGVDVITPDPGLPLAEVGGVILEVNTTPGYHYHYHTRDEPFPVALHVLRRLLADAAPLPRGSAPEGGGGRNGASPDAHGSEPSRRAEVP